MTTIHDSKRTDYRVLTALLNGSILKGVLSIEKLRNTLGLENTTVVHRLRTWESDGTILGYVPLLSEKGRRRFEALKTLYEDDGIVEEGGDGV